MPGNENDDSDGDFSGTDNNEIDEDVSLPSPPPELGSPVGPAESVATGEPPAGEPPAGEPETVEAAHTERAAAAAETEPKVGVVPKDFSYDQPKPEGKSEVPSIQIGRNGKSDFGNVREDIIRMVEYWDGVIFNIGKAENQYQHVCFSNHKKKEPKEVKSDFLVFYKGAKADALSMSKAFPIERPDSTTASDDISGVREVEVEGVKKKNGTGLGINLMRKVQKTN